MSAVCALVCVCVRVFVSYIWKGRVTHMNESCHACKSVARLDLRHNDIVLDGYCSTVQGLLDWFEVDLRFTELLFIQIDLCVMCVFVLHSPVSLSSCPLFLDILHCLPRAVGVPLESALNLVSCMSHVTRVRVSRVTYTRIHIHSHMHAHIFMHIYTRVSMPATMT